VLIYDHIYCVIVNGIFSIWHVIIRWFGYAVFEHSSDVGARSERALDASSTRPFFCSELIDFFVINIKLSSAC